MTAKGTLIEWNDDRGFGFIEPSGGGEKVFCHIKAFAVRVRRPQAGDAVTYRTMKDTKGRVHATDVRPSGVEGAAYKSNVRAPRKQARSTKASDRPGSAVGAYIFVTLFAASLVALVAANRISSAVPAVYIAMSGITLFAYAFDKNAAMNKRWRTQENTLHLLALLGGWPGALTAQLKFRHKSSKTSFLVTFWLCVILNLAALAIYSGLLSSIAPLPLE